MRIDAVTITNFRALAHLEMSGLRQFVVVAGANGSGKTTILDALRLLKSSYVADEMNQWYGEFGVQQGKPRTIQKLFRDPLRPAIVSATISLDPDEKAFLAESAERIFLAMAYSRSQFRKGAVAVVNGLQPLLSPDLPSEQRDAMLADARERAMLLRSELADSSAFQASVRLTPEPSIVTAASVLATAAFTCFNPANIGELDFHTSRRAYNRQGEGDINVRLGQGDTNQSRFLYGLENKYQNLKTRLTEELVRARLKGEFGSEGPLEASLKELFTTFLPGKTFLGVKVDQHTDEIRFDVELSTGEIHDIDELSSGEKEIVYGYLWLRTATPRRSIVMIDEPELHLNPALVQSLPGFYKTNLAEALTSQVWIVTHSDAILRTAARDESMDVFHIAAAAADLPNQAYHLSSADSVESAVLDLIGDLAAYRPHGLIVLVEGAKDTRFDVDMIGTLFPEHRARANFIPAGERNGVSRTVAQLRQVLVEAGLSARAVSICDGDSTMTPSKPSEGRFYWPAYEIENFLLEPTVLRDACKQLSRRDPFSSDDAVVERLRAIARSHLDWFAGVIVQDSLNQRFTEAIRVRPGVTALEDLVASALSSQHRLAELDVSREAIHSSFNEVRLQLEGSLDGSNDFLRTFPGDRLIHGFAGDLGYRADQFKNVCVSSAHRLAFKPPAMAETLNEALRKAHA